MLAHFFWGTGTIIAVAILAISYWPSSGVTWPSWTQRVASQTSEQLEAENRRLKDQLRKHQETSKKFQTEREAFLNKQLEYEYRISVLQDQIGNRPEVPPVRSLKEAGDALRRRYP